MEREVPEGATREDIVRRVASVKQMVREGDVYMRRGYEVSPGSRCVSPRG